jgi:hypothetical protein
MMMAGAPLGNRNAVGGKRSKAHRPAGGKNTATSATLTAIILQLRDVHALSWAQIVARLHSDFGIELSRAAVWQRYQRGKRA